jgi:O-antigen ligase
MGVLSGEDRGKDDVRATAGSDAARVGFRFSTMTIQQHPFTSGSHWRIPVYERRTAGAWAERLRLRWHGRALASTALVSTALAWFTLGGVFVAPLGALAALITLFTPGGDGMRPLAGPLIVGAAIWLALAVLCAHVDHIGSSSCAPDDTSRP